MTQLLENPPAARDACVAMVLEHFARVPRTEEAFYLRFQTLPRAHLAALKCAWREGDDWRIFCRIWRLHVRRVGGPRVADHG
jgi:hypothetical protein